MAETALATAFVSIVPGTKDLESYLKGKLQDDVAKPGEQAGKGFGTKFSGGLKGALAGIGGIFAIKGVMDFGGELITAAESGQKVDATLTNITSSMGLFGGKSADVVKRLQDVATAQIALTGVDDDVIKGAQAKLMTFSEVGKSADTMGGAFDRATSLSADLAAAGFGTIDSAATMLGKALQDPEKGMTALQRVGVSLSDAQKKQIKDFMAVGDVASAQKVILGEVEKQVGGTAAASATSSEKMKAQFEDIKQAMGTALLPAFQAVTDFVVANFVPAFKWISENMGTLAPVFGALGVILLAAVAPAIWGVVTATWAWTAAMLANPITWIVLGVAALVAGIILLAQNWDKVTKFFGDTIKNIGGWFDGLWKGIGKAWDGFIKAFEPAVKGIGNWFSDVFKAIGGFFKGAINGYLTMLENFINFFIKGINGILGAFNTILDGIKVATAGAIDLHLNPIGSVKLPRLAKGGFVDQATTAIIGEAGPEVVTPLKDFERMMGLDQAQSNERPIYADGIGLIGVMREVAKGESRIYFDNQIGRLSMGAR